MVVQIDQEWLVPLDMKCYGARDQLLARYEFREVKLNVKLGAEEFTPKANGL
jgi:outer membrane lipoprotein-sorting protein